MVNGKTTCYPSNPFYLKRKHLCPKCGTTLNLKKNKFIINTYKNPEEAKKYMLNFGSIRVSGNIEVTTFYFQCPKCNEKYEIPELQKQEKIRKLQKNANVGNQTQQWVTYSNQIEFTGILNDNIQHAIKRLFSRKYTSFLFKVALFIALASVFEFIIGTDFKIFLFNLMFIISIIPTSLAVASKNIKQKIIPFALITVFMGFISLLLKSVDTFMYWISSSFMYIYVVLDPPFKRQKFKIIPTRISINEKEIVAAFPDGSTATEEMKNVKKVIDYGDYYEFVFHVKSGKYYFCQKNLLSKGTLQDFETMFQNVIVKKYN